MRSQGLQRSKLCQKNNHRVGMPVAFPQVVDDTSTKKKDREGVPNNILAV